MIVRDTEYAAWCAEVEKLAGPCSREAVTFNQAPVNYEWIAAAMQRQVLPAVIDNFFVHSPFLVGTIDNLTT